MNILGHSYIATKCILGNRDLLIIGSLLPETAPFIANNPFTYDEIHEGGEKLFEFLSKKYPQMKDLALGMITHSYKSGADGWNKRIEKYAGDKREEILKEIVEASKINFKIAPTRLHNFLWWGVDFLILQNYPKFVNEVGQALTNVKVEEIARLLSECFKKDNQEVLRIFKILFGEIYQVKDLNSVAGLAHIWARQAAGLPENDRVDVKKATKLIEKTAFLLKKDFSRILNFVIKETKKNIELLPSFRKL